MVRLGQNRELSDLETSTRNNCNSDLLIKLSTAQATLVLRIQGEVYMLGSNSFMSETGRAGFGKCLTLSSDRTFHSLFILSAPVFSTVEALVGYASCHAHHLVDTHYHTEW